ncbi:hypothetical protein ABPG72_009237 [Tetrahymena utriculariae]
MAEYNQNSILANISIKMSSKDTMKSNRNIMINFENQLQQKVEDMFKTDGLKILVKRGKTFGLITTRYYKIVRDFLYYYKSQTNTSKPKGILNLRDSSLKVELEYGKIIKEKQFGLKVQSAKTHGVFWLVSQNQAENIILFKYLKLLNGQFQIKQLPLLSNRNLRGANSSIINNSLCSQGEGGLENMISEEKINQIEFMDAQLNLALRNIDSSVVLKIDKPQIEDINGTQYNSNKQVYYIGEENKNNNSQFVQQNINQNIFTNQINGPKDRSNNQGDSFLVDRKEIIQQPNVILIKRDFFPKKQEIENEQIFEEEEGFQNKQCGQVQYHNSSTYFGESQKQSTKNNQVINYASQQNLRKDDQVIHLELQISPKKKQPHTASSLNERNSSGNKSHLYQISYSPNFNNMYGKDYDDEFLQREIGDLQQPSSPKQVIQFDDDYDEEYIDYYGEINFNFSNGVIGSAITSQNTLNQIKRPQADFSNPSSQIILLNQNNTTQQNISQNQIMFVEASSHFTQMLSPLYQKQESNFLQKFNSNEDYAQQLNQIKEQSKKIEESIKTSEQMLHYYKEQYEQIKKSISCLDAEEQHENNNNNQILSEIYSKGSSKNLQAKQLLLNQIKSQKNENNKPAIHNQSKSDTNQLQYFYVDQFYEDINYNQEQHCQIPYQNQFNSHNSLEFNLQLNDRLKNKSAPHSPNTSILKENKFNYKSEQDENIAEESEEGSNDQFNSRYCRNMDILSNNNPHQRTQTDLALQEAVADENSSEEDDYFLSEKPREDNCNEIKESKYQSGISNRTTNYQTSEYKIVLNEEQKKLNKEMKEICNQENSLKQIEDLDFKILDEIKDEVGRNVSQISKPNPFTSQQHQNIRRSKSAISQQKNATNQIKYKARASVKNISQSNIYDEGEEEEDESEYIDNLAETSQKMKSNENIYNKYKYEEDEVIQISKTNQKEQIQIDSSGNVFKQLEQSISQGSSNSHLASPQPRNSPTLSTKKQENEQKEFTLMNSYKKKQISDLLENDLKQSKDYSSQKRAQNLQKNEICVKKSQKAHNQMDFFEFQDNQINDEKLNSSSIYVCLEEICQMIWKNFIREAQEQIQKLKQRFLKKQFLIEIADLEIELLIISFSGQVENLNIVCEKVDQILKSIKLEQKQKQNFYDLCLCDINQAELFLIKGIIQYMQNKKL